MTPEERLNKYEEIIEVIMFILLFYVFITIFLYILVLMTTNTHPLKITSCRGFKIPFKGYS